MGKVIEDAIAGPKAVDCTRRYCCFSRMWGWMGTLRMILNLVVSWSGEWDVLIDWAREWRSVMSRGCAWREREMWAVTKLNMLRRALFLTQTNWMALYKRSE